MSCSQYKELDPTGVSIGIISFIIAVTYAYFLLKKLDLNRKSIITIMLVSAVGHFIGACGFFEFSVRIGSDSCFYFANATMKYQGLGYWFAFMMLGYAKEYILGESFLGAFLISGAIGLIASTYLLLIYKTLLDKISGQNRFYLIDKRQIVYPAMLLMCWPSYLFWSAGIIKDNFAFLAIMMTLFVIVQGKYKLSSYITLAIASFLGFMVRPYLFIIFSVSTFLYILMGSKVRIQYKFFVLSLLGIAFILLAPLLSDYAAMINLEGSVTIKHMGEYLVRQQANMAIGSSIPVPTHNPHLIFFFIPWLFFANLLLPLGIGASNLIGAVSSIENFYLLWWILWFIKHRTIWMHLSQNVKVTKFLMIYFLFGMTCLSVMCTNLGLAMREKMMYVPPLLVCMFLTYAYKRILMIRNYCEQQDINTMPILGYR